MEMVLELEKSNGWILFTMSFNPSSNGNGAGMIRFQRQRPQTVIGFNPSSNGNGAGISSAKQRILPMSMFQSFF